MNKYLVIGTLLLMAGAGHAAAQSAGQYRLDWHTCNSAVSACGNPPYVVSGTIGQLDPGIALGGNFRLAGGFWPGMGPTEFGPALRIANSAGSVVLSWPDSAVGYHLEHSSDLVHGSWLSNATPVFSFGTNQVVVEPAANLRFYRLVKP